MRSRLAAVLVMPVFALAACGSSKDVDTTSYTCGQFNKSLRTKADDSSGNFINGLRKKAKLGQLAKVERSEITLGIILTCRGKAASTRPADNAVKIAKEIKSGKFKVSTKKKSTK